MFAPELTSFQIAKEMEVNREKGIPNVAAIATGSIEQHGPLLPLNTDTFIAEKALEELDRHEKARLFLFPSLQYTNADSGLSFAGTLSVSRDTFRMTLRDTTKCIQKQGFDALLFLDGHATNNPSLMEEAYDAVSRSFAENTPFPVIVLSLYQFYNEIKDKYNIEIGRHADWFEGMLFKAAGGRIPGGTADEPDPYPEKVLSPPGIVGIPLEMRSDRGVIGRITNDIETEELGNNIWHDMVDMLLKDFRTSLKQFYDQFKK